MSQSPSIVPYMEIFALLFVTTSVGPADAAIGYDCGGLIRNMTTMSLVDIDDCDLNIDNIDSSTEDIALVQLNEFKHLTVRHCKIEISRVINHCGMFSHSSLVSNGRLSYIEKVSREDCENAFKSGAITVKNISITELQLNKRTDRSLTIAGYINEKDGGCSGVHYEDPYGSWDGVTVAGTVAIHLFEDVARVKVEDDQIFLPSGYSCKLSKGECIDPVGGYAFWDPVPKEDCTHSYSLVYKGAATKLVSNNRTVYTVNASDTSFSFTAIAPVSSCNVTLLRTESSKLFIVDSNNLKDLGQIKAKTIDIDNMNIFQYVNAKFVYVERHIRSQVKSLYLDVMRHQCRLEKEILKNTLAIAATQPDEFAFRYMGGPGYMAVMAGEVVHIVHCIPVEVTYRHVDKCYNRLPVARGNDSLFLMPRTHILSKNANEIQCNAPLPEYYKLERRWYKLTPKRVETEEPLKLKPSSKMTWTYERPADLLASGIYKQADLDAMQERIMNPMETRVKTEIMSQQISNGMQGQVNVENYLLDYVKNKMFPDIMSLIWGPFSWFGSVAAGCVGIFMILKMIKFVLDIIINAYMLYSEHGWSYRILGAFWISLTNLSLCQTKEEDKIKPETVELVNKKNSKNKHQISG